MDYHPIHLCIRSIIETEVPGRYLVDMPTVWWPDARPLNVDMETIDIVMGDRWDVPMCPPGWPDPPEMDSKDTK